MSLTTEISIGQLIPLILFLFTLMGGAFAHHHLSKSTAKKVDAIEKDVRELDKRLDAHSLHMAEKLVKKEDMAVMEARLTKQIDGLGDTVRETSGAINRTLAEALSRLMAAKT